ncbi:atp synthase subunit 6 [Ceraceosorus bombacis]|uniref:ATP synthase subunit a n=1 Tax=Ceraceosorus bombacis TaxID=401625 RepID=A0A0P1A3L8_9BASI|nr:atp synthase subunit 6 [Ceraceosorus bombacis]
MLIQLFHSPMDHFEVQSLISLNLPILGYINFSLTNLGLYTLIAIYLSIAFHVLGNNDNKLIPNYWSIALETGYASVLSLVKSQVGAANEVYLPFIYSLFFFLLFANLSGNVPYSFTVFTSGIASIGLSMVIFIGVTILGLSIHKAHFFSFFVPSGAPAALIPLLVPIEIVSYLARSLSLGVRLFANLISGHTLITILSSFIAPLFTGGILSAVLALVPFTIFLAIVGLEVAVSVVQAYVFCILTASYLKDAIDLH